MVRVTAIVLAAGLSSRMGERDKLFLPIGRKPMIQKVMETLAAVDFQEIWVVGSEKTLPQLKPILPSSFRLVENADYLRGMTSSIQAGVRAAAPTDGYLIGLGDQPFLSPGTLEDLKSAFAFHFSQNPKTIVVPFYQGRKGNPVLFSAAYRNEILQHRAPEGCKEIVRQNWDMVEKVEVTDKGILQDIDTREEYKKWGAV